MKSKKYHWDSPPSKRELINLINKGLTNKEIAKYYDVCDCYITIWFRLYNMQGKCNSNIKPKVNMVGKVYGSLTIIRQATKKECVSIGRKRSRDCWVAKCICGNEIIVYGHDIRHHGWDSSYCGKCKKGKEKAAYNRSHVKNDLTNKKIGNLLYKRRATKSEIEKYNVPKSLRKAPLWFCKCDCGSYTVLPANRTSCKKCSIYNRNKIEDLTGKQFGNWKVIRLANEKDLIKYNLPKSSKSYWLCECSCKNKTKKLILAKRLKNGSSTSCGCIHSKGEVKIISILKENNINFKYQYPLCRNPKTGYKLYTDFFVEDKYVIEFDGNQHKEPSKNKKSYYYNTKKFKNGLYRDKIKNKYCFLNNIPIIRIPYEKLKTLSLNDLLLKTSKFILKEDIK